MPHTSWPWLEADSRVRTCPPREAEPQRQPPLALLTAYRHGRPRSGQPSLDLAGQLGRGWTGVSADVVFDFSAGLRRIADAAGGLPVPPLASLQGLAASDATVVGCFCSVEIEGEVDREINGWEQEWEVDGRGDKSDAMRQRLTEKYVNACIDDESVGEGFVGTIRDIVWDTNKAAWIAQIHPDAGEPKSYPVASLPALMVNAVQPEGIFVVPGSRDGFVDVELCDEEGSESEDDDAPNEDDVAGPAPPTQAPAAAEEATDTEGPRRSTRARKKARM